MVMFQAIVPNAEVNGETVLSVVNGMEAFKTGALKILEGNGIVDPKPGQWYLQQNWLNAFKQISEKIGAGTLFLIGKKIPENAKWPPTIDTVEKGLASIDVAYHMNHRINGKPLFNPATGQTTEGIGHYHFHRLGEKSFEMVCNNPYPCDFDRGIIDAVARKFKPQTVQLLAVNVRHDDTRECRKTGGKSCTYLVSW